MRKDGAPQKARPHCTHCSSQYVIKHDRNKHGDQIWRCKKCGKNFEYQHVPEKKELSGVIPVPCREREWKPLRRNPFAHAELALLTR